MGGGLSKQPDVGQRRYLRGRTEAVVKTFIPYYQRQVAAAFLRRLWSEGDTQGRHSQQLLQCQVWKSPKECLLEGPLLHFKENSLKWKERHVVVRGDYTLEWLEDKRTQVKDCDARGCTSLSGYQLVTTLTEYSQLVDEFCRVRTVGSSEKGLNPLASLPTAFPIFLYHPFRKHLYFCSTSAESQHTWKCSLLDGIRHHNTVLQRGDSFHVEAFLEAVRFFRQEKGRYGPWELLVGTETEIVSNLVMEDLLPVLESSVAATLRGTKVRQRSSWFKFLQEGYSLVLAQICAEFEAYQEEKDIMHRQLEKKIRPELDQLLALKDEISDKLQALVGTAARACCNESVRPELEQVIEEVMGPVSMGLEAVRTAFNGRITDVITGAEGCSVISLQKEVFSLGDMPWDAVLMQQCYKKAVLAKDALQGLSDRFELRSVSWLLLRALNLMQQFMQNSVYTFQQLTSPHLTSSADPTWLIQALGKVKGRVLKKFDSDSARARRRFARDVLLHIFLPFLLRRLEPECKRELHKYDCYVFADYSTILHVENIYEEMVRGVLLEAINEVLKGPSRQNRHVLGSESFASILDSAENLLRLDRGLPDGRAGRETPERGSARGSDGLSAAADVEHLPQNRGQQEYADTTRAGYDEAGALGNSAVVGRVAAACIHARHNGAPQGDGRSDRNFDGVLLTERKADETHSHTTLHTQNGGAYHFTNGILMQPDTVIYENVVGPKSQDQASRMGPGPSAVDIEETHMTETESGLQGEQLDVTERSVLLEGLSMEIEMTISQIDKDLLEIDQPT